MRKKRALTGAGGALLAIAVAAAPVEETAEETPAETYARSCAACHGKDLDGGRAGSLVDDVWIYGAGDRDGIAKSIRDGVVDAGMPSYARSLSEAQIAGLVGFVVAKGKERR